MSQTLPHDKIEMLHGPPDIYMIKIEEIFNTLDVSQIGYFIEVDLRYPNIIKERTKNSPFCPEKKVVPKDSYIDYMKKVKQ